MGRLGFRTYEHHGDAVFVHEGMVAANRKVDEALESLEAGRLSYGRLVDRMDALLAKEPLLVEGHASKGYALFEMGLFDDALEAYAAGVAVCDAVIPKDYSGTLPWGQLDNRPFLRCLHGLAMSRLAVGKVDEGMADLKRIMLLNPNDNQGIRYILASRHLRAGTKDEVEAALELVDEQGEMQPDIHFDAALHLFREGDVPGAISSVRLGVLGTRYVLRAILKGAERLPQPQDWTENQEVERAQAYAREGSAAWHGVPGAMIFLSWLADQPVVVADRHARRAYDEAMATRDFERRSAVMMRMSAARDAVDRQTSEYVLLDARIDADHDWNDGVPRRGLGL